MLITFGSILLDNYLHHDDDDDRDGDGDEELIVEAHDKDDVQVRTN